MSIDKASGTRQCARVIPFRKELPVDEHRRLAADPEQAKRRKKPTVEEKPSAPPPRKNMSRRRLKRPSDPLFALTSLANDVVDRWERETESDCLSARWEQASAIQRETFICSLNTLMETLVASTEQIMKALK
jgi:hypothetical protein